MNALGDAQDEDAVAQLGYQGGVIEVTTEPQTEFIVELGALEVGGGEVDPHDVALAADNDEIGTPHDYFHARGIYAGQENIDRQVFAVLLAVVVRLPSLSQREGLDGGQTTFAKQLRR
ncbi:MAG: hypothetical protein RIQ79_2069 [Verrucomicrobiota bacterium]